ncbi:AraC family transcriptional regulator [Alcanivorax sp. N3-2A]|nr:AraC family transcriptional regulator [Alcanivorax sp. N3-2A]|tara:strand:- start:117753 stop:118649 length:897 start_codon:yes stop_codon:yes gene_type:complete
MSDSLRQAVHCYTQRHANASGVAGTPVSGLLLIRGTAPSALEHAIANPLICLVLQGSKQVSIGNRNFTFVGGDSMIVTANQPTVTRISQASVAAPYLALALDLDPAVIAELGVAINLAESAAAEASADVEAGLRDAMLRLLRLLERPRSLAVLQKQLLREIHYWLLLGEKGAAIRHLGLPDSRVRRVARAVALLRRDYARPLTIAELAAAAGMSRSSFHQHFRAVTSVSPLQFQKQLRLIEARRLMLVEGKTASRAAFDVGYVSVPQFTREYARLYGQPPVRDRKLNDPGRPATEPVR